MNQQDTYTLDGLARALITVNREIDSMLSVCQDVPDAVHAAHVNVVRSCSQFFVAIGRPISQHAAFDAARAPSIAQAPPTKLGQVLKAMDQLMEEVLHSRSALHRINREVLECRMAGSASWDEITHAVAWLRAAVAQMSSADEPGN